MNRCRPDQRIRRNRLLALSAAGHQRAFIGGGFTTAQRAFYPFDAGHFFAGLLSLPRARDGIQLALHLPSHSLYLRSFLPMIGKFLFSLNNGAVLIKQKTVDC